MRNWRADVAARIEGMRLRPEREAEILDEVSQHLEDRYTELKLNGASEDVAVAGALEELETLPVLREGLNALRFPQPAVVVSGTPQQSWWAALGQDIHMAARSIRHAKVYATLTVLVLAFGIGLNVAVFALAGRALLASKPVPEPSTLVYLYPDRAATPASRLAMRDFSRATSELFETVGRHSDTTSVVTSARGSVRRGGEQVSANYFSVLRLAPALGRAFTESDDDPFNQSRGVIISHALWRELFDSSPSALGQTVTLSDREYAVIGVMPADFRGLSAPWQPADFWVSRAQGFHQPTPEQARSLDRVGGAMIARLQPGVTVSQARATLGRGLPTSATPLAVRVESADNIFVASEPDEAQLWVLAVCGAAMMLGLLVLVITVTNVAGLSATRGITRTTENAIRQALGASAARVARERLAESLLLSLLAGVIGLALGAGALRLYRAHPPSAMLLDSSVDAQVVAFAALIAILVGLLSGAGPARQVLGRTLHEQLGPTQTSLSKRQRQRLGYSVLVPQVVLSTAMVFAGTTYVTNVLAMNTLDLGYQVHGKAIVTVEMPWHDGPEHEKAALKRDIERSLTARLSSVPGFRSFSLSSMSPTSHQAQVFTRYIDDTDPTGNRRIIAGSGGMVTPNYFEALDIRLVAGRYFDDRDSIDSPRVAVVTESFVQRMWPSGDWRGRRVSRATGTPSWREVVGVVEDTRSALQTEGDRPLVYSAFGQSATDLGFPMTAIVSIDGDERRQLARIVDALRSDPRIRARDALTLSERIEQDRYPVRAMMWLLTTVGVAGALAVGIGLFGMLSFTVAQRTREWGIRAALGATPLDLQWLVGKGALWLLLLGGIPGIAAGFGVMRILTSLTRAAPQAPTGIVGVVVTTLISLIVLAAAWLPAKRAGAVDPLRVLRRS